MYEQYMGVIKALGFNFVPDEWGWCSGGFLDVNQFTALFSLLGCRFGGDCRTSFGLPDLRGRSPMGFGTGPGLTPRFIGQEPGLEQEVLGYSHMASHSHGHAYMDTSGSAFSVHVAGQGGKKQLPDTGDYIAAPGNSFGQPQDNLFLAPADVTTTVAVGGVLQGSGEFDNSRFVIGSTPQATDYVPITQPSLAMNYCICMEGLYPARS